MTKYAIEVKSSDGFRPMRVRQFDSMTEATLFALGYEAMDSSIETRVVPILAQEAKEAK